MNNDGFSSFFYEKLNNDSNKKNLPLKMKYWKEYDLSDLTLTPSYTSKQIHTNKFTDVGKYKPTITPINITKSQIG